MRLRQGRARALSELKIVALAIAKNEEATIERWYKNVSKIAEKVIILDTGSTDKTVEIALSLGIEVFEYKFEEGTFSFAEARNKALDCVELDADWLIFTDVDEIISEGSIHYLLEQIEWVDYNDAFAHVDALLMILRNRNDDGTIKTTSRNVNPRIIRLSGGRRYQFVGALHEQLARDDFENLVPPVVHATAEPIFIDHYGYTKEAIERTHKAEQRIKLAQSLCEQNPKSLRYKEWLASALSLDGQFEAADKIRTDAKRQLLNEVYEDVELSVQMLRNLMVGRFRGKEDYNGFIALYVMAINLLPNCPDFDYLFGCLCDQDGMGSAAHALMVAADQKFNKLGNIIGETAYNPENAMRIIKKWSEKKNE